LGRPDQFSRLARGERILGDDGLLSTTHGDADAWASQATLRGGGGPICTVHFRDLQRLRQEVDRITS
jgi:hypothetical protein